MTRIALITGASKGIGKSLAYVFAEHGYSLLLVARNLPELETIKRDLELKYACICRVASVDLKSPDCVVQIEHAFGDDFTRVDVLINNAGIGFAKKFTDISLTDTMATMVVNMNALTQLTHRLLPVMVQRRSGSILNVASTAAFFPGPYMAVYYASKAFVLSLSESLHEEYRQDGVHVSVLCPGVTKTHFFESAGMLDLPMLHQPLFPLMTSDAVARAAYHGLMKKRRVIIPGLMNKLNVCLSRITPRWLAGRVVAGLQVAQEYKKK